MDEQDPEITVPQLDLAAKRFLERLPQELRDLFGSFWTPMRQHLRSQQEAIQDERRALEQTRLAIRRSEREHEQTQPAIEELLSNTVLAQEASTTPSPTPRPSTPDFVLDARLRTKQEANSMCASLVPDGQIAMLKTIPPEWARDKLESTRDVLQDNNAGCWFSNAKPKKGPYTLLNLVKTPHPSGQGNIGFAVYRHRLAIVAKGEASLLALASTNYQISHLCHNGGCFRPEHLEMEPAELNTARNECRGRSILMLPDGVFLHPCPHWDWLGSRGHPKCILPVEYIPENTCMYVELRSNGEYKYVRSDR